MNSQTTKKYELTKDKMYYIAHKRDSSSQETKSMSSQTTKSTNSQTTKKYELTKDKMY